MADVITAFIETHILYGQSSQPVTLDTPLGEGLVDSLGFERLVAFIEDEYGLTISQPEIVPENFRTVREIERFVRHKQAAA